MHVEIQVALNFLISFLYNKLPRRRVNQFGEELENALKLKFEGHWYPEKPFKGSAYRCLKTTQPLDPVFEIAAREAGMELSDIAENLPSEVSIWIDPGEVSYRMTEKGPVKILYSEKELANGGGAGVPSAAPAPSLAANLTSFADEAAETPIARDMIASRGFNPEAQCFKPQMNGLNGHHQGAHHDLANQLGAMTLNGPVPPTPIYKQAPAPVAPVFGGKQFPAQTMTTAAFAQTKFGSTKLKTNSKRTHRMSPTEFSNYIKSRQSGGVPTLGLNGTVNPNHHQGSHGPNGMSLNGHSNGYNGHHGNGHHGGHHNGGHGHHANGHHASMHHVAPQAVTSRCMSPANNNTLNGLQQALGANGMQGLDPQFIMIAAAAAAAQQQQHHHSQQNGGQMSPTTPQSASSIGSLSLQQMMDGPMARSRSSFSSNGRSPIPSIGGTCDVFSGSPSPPLASSGYNSDNISLFGSSFSSNGSSGSPPSLFGGFNGGHNGGFNGLNGKISPIPSSASLGSLSGLLGGSSEPQQSKMQKAHQINTSAANQFSRFASLFESSSVGTNMASSLLTNTTANQQSPSPTNDVSSSAMFNNNSNNNNLISFSTSPNFGSSMSQCSGANNSATSNNLFAQEMGSGGGRFGLGGIRLQSNANSSAADASFVSASLAEAVLGTGFGGFGSSQGIQSMAPSGTMRSDSSDSAASMSSSGSLSSGPSSKENSPSPQANIDSLFGGASSPFQLPPIVAN